MANFYGSARSNYFRVKDAVAFKAEMGDYEAVEVESKTGEDGSVYFAVFGNDPDSGMFPDWVYDQESDEMIEVDFYNIVSKHLIDDEVAIFMSCGAEKLRYIQGDAIAINNKGESEFLSIGDIYKRAERLGKNITSAEY